MTSDNTKNQEFLVIKTPNNNHDFRQIIHLFHHFISISLLWYKDIWRFIWLVPLNLRGGMIYGIQFLKKINNHGIPDETAEDI
jgi:hypothetical protein